jgi:glucosyl-3-phosphoglycerate synthase
MQQCLRPMSQSLVAAASDFDPGRLAEVKAAQATTISVCLPARNEESTVGAIVTAVRRALIDAVPLVDEVVVMDDGSSDATARVAADAGARVVPAAAVLPELCCGTGKGEVMWKSLYASTGDIVCWLDADLLNFEPHFVSGLVGPLLTRPSIGFVKGFYRRPLGDDPSGGGRVTELMARPLISTFFPHLTGVVQPLGGEYAGRRHALEQVPFVEGWGVEIGLLVDVVHRFGIQALAQVNLGVREHRNRSLAELAPTAMAILQIALRRVGIDTGARGHELVRYVDGAIERVPVEVRERPPIIEVPAYRAKFGRELSA